jgi:predicted SnoaL-like aldol condensation-catalyzing enzyme
MTPVKHTIITATIARPTLERILAQEWPDWVLHLLVVDGPEHIGAVNLALKNAAHRCVASVMPWGTKCAGNYARAAGTTMVSAGRGGFFSYLDDDNFFKPAHYFKFVESVHESGKMWGACRRIYVNDGEPVAFENKESWHIDTNCMVVHWSLAPQLAHMWCTDEYTADRSIAKFLRYTYPQGKEVGNSIIFYETGEKYLKYKGRQLMELAPGTAILT